MLAELREELVPLVAEIQQSGRRPDTSLLHRDVSRRRAGAVRTRGGRGDRLRLRPRAARRDGPSVLHDARARTTAASPPATTSTSSTRPFSASCTRRATASTSRACPPNISACRWARPISLGIHESQSRLWENLVGRSRAFWKHFYPVAQQRFPAALGDVPLDDFYFAINDVRPSLIRVEADEATYNLHILIRFELERALLDGDLQAADLPGAWNEKYRQYLGITPPDNRNGVLQDVHWSAGLVGYFPTYSLGNLYAAQFFAQAEAELGDLAAIVRPGRFPAAARLAAREDPPPRAALFGGRTGPAGDRPPACRPSRWSSICGRKWARSMGCDFPIFRSHRCPRFRVVRAANARCPSLPAWIRRRKSAARCAMRNTL